MGEETKGRGEKGRNEERDVQKSGNERYMILVTILVQALHSHFQTPFVTLSSQHVLRPHFSLIRHFCCSIDGRDQRLIKDNFLRPTEMQKKKNRPTD